MNNQIIFHILFSTYFNDGRVKTYTTFLEKSSIKYHVFCIEDEKTGENVSSLKLKKYQGKNLFFYLIRLIKFFFFVSREANKIVDSNTNLILHFHNMPNFLVFIKYLIRVKSKKVILDNHDLFPIMMKSKFNSKILYSIAKMEQNQSMNVADKVLCADEGQMDFLIESGINKSKITPILNVPNTFIFESRKVEPRDKNVETINMVYHGTISYRLGQDLIIKAINLIKDKVPNLVFHLIGKGETVEELKKLVENYQLERNVIIYDKFFPLEDIPNILLKMDIGILPQRNSLQTSTYGFPVKLFEYVIMNIPVIAPRYKAIQRYFSEEMVCFFEPENIENMAEKILYLYTDSNARNEYTTQAKEFFKAYNYNTEMGKYEQVIKTLTN